MTTTAQTPHPAIAALPPKAVWAEDWQAIDDDGRFYRNFDGENREVAAGTKYGKDLVVFAHGVQHENGRIEDGTDGFFGAPLITFLAILDDGQRTDTDLNLTSDAARRLADVLVTAADEADAWAAR